MERLNSNKISVAISYCGEYEKEVDHFKKMIEDHGWETSFEINYTNYTNMPHMGPDFYDVGYIVHEN